MSGREKERDMAVIKAFSEKVAAVLESYDDDIPVSEILNAAEESYFEEYGE